MIEDVVRTFREIYLAKRMGILVCDSYQVRRAVYFRSGFIVGARSNREEDRLGQVLIRHGRITPQNLEDASRFIGSGWKLGEILAELHVLDRTEIEKFLRIQVVDVACAMLTQRPDRLAFSDLTAVEGSLSSPLSVASVVMEAARRAAGIENLLKAIREDDRRLGFSSNPLLRFQDVDLSPEEAYVLSRIDGREATAAIFSLSPLSEEQTARTLLGLLQAGIIEPEGEPGLPKGPPAEGGRKVALSAEDARREIEKCFEEFHHQDHWGVLGFEAGASARQIKQAFYEKARRYHPDRFRNVADPDFQEKVSYVFSRVAEAFETLTTRAKAEDYKKLAEKEPQYEEQRQARGAPTGAEPTGPAARTRNPAQATALFKRAKAAYDLQDYWSAIQLCQQAIEIVSDRAEFYHLLGTAQARNPKWRQDAEQNFKIAINLDPWKVEYLAALGELYLNAGMPLRAQRLFEQAKAVDPTFSIPRHK